MDTIRSMSVASVAQFMVLGAMSPVFADAMEDDLKQARPHGRTHVHAVSHSRGDYPVIWNWMPAVESTQNSASGEK